MEDNLVRDAKLFAAIAHKDQKRKYSGSPYIVHPAAVARTVKHVGGTKEMIAAAWLHDTVEDTSVTYGDIYGTFGEKVGHLVMWLTKITTPADGNRAVRKTIEIERLSRAPDAAKIIKLADLIDNSDIIEDDANFGPVFLKEMKVLVDAMGDCKNNKILFLTYRTLENYGY